jgi:Fe-S-cluster containining protein
MKLDVLQSDDAGQSWYEHGLKFTCTQCGNCCTGGPGFVWISDVEIERLAEHLQMTTAEVTKKYCRKVAGRLSLKERRTKEGNYDCVFLKEQPADAGSGGPSPSRRKTCSVYSVRPLQCRTWPFWSGNLASPKAWNHAAKRCHGMGRGHRHFAREQIDSLRDAEDWPDNPPTSGGKKK